MRRTRPLKIGNQVDMRRSMPLNTILPEPQCYLQYMTSKVICAGPCFFFFDMRLLVEPLLALQLSVATISVGLAATAMKQLSKVEWDADEEQDGRTQATMVV